MIPTAIGNAFAVLTDADKKKRYDKYGDENPQSVYTHDHYDYSRGFEGKLSVYMYNVQSSILFQTLATSLCFGFSKVL